MMNYQDYTDLLLPALETKLQDVVLDFPGQDYHKLKSMLAYHMGWDGPGAGPKAQGKRLRPFFLLLSAIATEKDWKNYLPLAAAVELVHNFSLIHDDIEDNSPLRRGRETLWKIWGIPQAINAGDLLFTIAHHTVHQCHPLLGAETTLEAARLLLQTCVRLTRGQFLDMDFEQRCDVTSDEYLTMIEGKTSALFGCCFEMGALQSSPAIRAAMKNYGACLGLAFQIQDDILGLWGDSAQTGKSSQSDLVSGKKTFPILYAVQNKRAFRERWQQGHITADEASGLSAELMDEGIYDYTKSIVKEYTLNAISFLHETGLKNPAVDAMIEVAGSLSVRNN